MKKLGILAAVLVLLLGIGCGDDDDDGSGGSGGSDDAGASESGSGGSGGMDAGTSGTGGESGTGGNAGTAGAEPMDAGEDGGAPPPTLADLQGTWVGPCYEDSGDFRRAVLEFDGNSATMILEFYGESGSTCEEVVLSIAMEMDVSVGGQVPQQPGVYTLNVEITGVEAAMSNADAVTYANTEGLFGYTDWELDVPKDVEGREFAPSDADAGAGDALPEAGTQTQLFFALNATKDRLRISDMGSGGGLSREEYVKQ